MSKYGNKKVTINGINFDSKIEGAYYEHLLELQKQGLVESFDMQVPFILLEGYEIAGRKVRPIKYVADFVIKYTNGQEEVVDTKGFLTSDAKLKIKMFESKFQRELKLITYSKIDNGWITLSDLEKARKQRKQLKNKKD